MADGNVADREEKIMGKLERLHALDAMACEAAESGLYEETDDLPAIRAEKSALAECDGSVVCPATLHWDGCAYDAFPDDLTPERNRPAKGQPAYVIGEVLDPGYALYDLEREWASGLATLIREEESGFTMRRAEARFVTSNPKVARADAATRKRWGWDA